MKRIICSTLAALAITTASAEDLSGPAATDTTTGFKVVDTITGTSLRFIQSALPELSRYGYSFKLDEYRIIVVTTGGHHAVIFRHLNTPPGSMGSPPGKPTFEVELSEDGTVIRSGFAQ
jgi:hypothetical protein